jgi:uncharacterized protein YjeT (DUF2065 family)
MPTPVGRCETAAVTTSIDHRHVARLLATGRVGLGLLLFLRPRSARSWVGDVVDQPGGRVAIRAVGARDLVIGAGVLRALDRGESIRPWLAFSATADLADTVATMGAIRRLPRGALGSLVLAAGSAAISLAGLAEVD